MNVITVSQAKPKIGSLVDQALRGEPVLIRKGNRLVQMTEYVVPEPIPDRPPGYFNKRSAHRSIANTAPANQEPN